MNEKRIENKLPQFFIDVPSTQNANLYKRKQYSLNRLKRERPARYGELLVGILHSFAAMDRELTLIELNDIDRFNRSFKRKGKIRKKA
jgi:hypothetical protein